MSIHEMVLQFLEDLGLSLDWYDNIKFKLEKEIEDE